MEKAKIRPSTEGIEKMVQLIMFWKSVSTPNLVAIG